MEEWVQGTRQVDALILTALRMEFEAVLKVDAGAVPSSVWEEMRSPFGLPVAFRSYMVDRGRPLRIGVAVAPAMGDAAAVNTLLPLIGELKPRCIAMCGVCAGRQDKGVRLGDVVAADRLYYLDTGKQLPDQILQDLTTYNLRPQWKAALDAMATKAAAHFQDQEWFQTRPLTREWREYRALVALRDEHADLQGAVERNLEPGEWADIVAALRSHGLLAPSGRCLTDHGRQVVDDLLLSYGGALPDLSPGGEHTLQRFQLHVAPTGTGTRVIEDKRVWTFVSQAMRRTLGLEMEAASLGAVAHYQTHYKLDAIVMKGVMDFADHGRDDHFKRFAARASAECLLWFLREQLATDAGPEYDDVLTPGTVRLPDIRQALKVPSLLLNARSQVVPWRNEGRAATLAKLDAWVDTPKTASVRLLHGEGGIGKTRLAIEWVRRRRECSDVAGFLVPAQDPALRRADGWLERLCGYGRPVIIVIDYAESRSDLGEVIHRIEALESSLAQRNRIRVLLLARNAGAWWRSLPRHRDGDAFEPLLDGPMPLSPLTTTPADRQAAFVEASQAFADFLQKAPVLQSPINLDHVLFDRALYLHMAALAAVKGLFDQMPSSITASADLAMPHAVAASSDRATPDASDLLDRILDHEEHLWEEAIRSEGRSINVGLARQLVAAATLRGNLPTWSDTRLTYERLKMCPFDLKADAPILELLHHVYTCGGRGSYLPGLKPDLLGEGMLVRVACPPDGRGVRVDDDWIDLVIGSSDDPPILTTTLMVLAHASSTNSSTVMPWIARLLRGKLDRLAVLALRVAKAVGRRTAAAMLGDVLADALAREGSYAIALQLNSEQIPYPSVSLARVGEWVTKTLINRVHVGDNDGSLAMRGQLLYNWGLWLAALNRRAGALAAAQQAVGLYRTLTKRHRGAYQQQLVMSLDQLSAYLLAKEQYDEAVTTLQQAVAISRDWVVRDPLGFQPRLATTLGTLGSALSMLGRREEAVNATRESVDTLRRLASGQAEAFQIDLAQGLTSLSTMELEVGRRKPALDAIEEAVGVWQALAAQEPDAFQPSLGSALTNLSAIARELGQHASAFAAANEAVKLFRALASRDTGTYRSDLAESLTNLGVALGDKGDHTAALVHTDAAIELFEDLVAQRPGTFEADLADCVSNRSLFLCASGTPERALVPARDAVSRYRALAARRPDAHRPGLARILLCLSTVLSTLDQHTEARDALHECSAMFRELATRLPDAFEILLARSLARLGLAERRMGQHEAAAAALGEAMDIYRAHQARHPDVFDRELAGIAEDAAALE